MLDRIGDDGRDRAGKGQVNRLVDGRNHLRRRCRIDDARLRVGRERPMQHRYGIGEGGGGVSGIADDAEGRARIAGRPVGGITKQAEGGGGIVAQCSPGCGGNLGSNACRFAAGQQNGRLQGGANHWE